jgi:hypothetical protein
MRARLHKGRPRGRKLRLQTHLCDLNGRQFVPRDGSGGELLFEQSQQPRLIGHLRRDQLFALAGGRNFNHSALHIAAHLPRRRQD